MKKILLFVICSLFILTGCTIVEEVRTLTIGEISDWCKENIIDNGLNEINNYLSDNTNINIDETLNNLKDSMSKLEKYNDQIQALDDQEIKDAWDKLYNEMQKNYEAIRNQQLNPDQIIEDFDTTKLEQYQKEFEKLINQQ